MAVRPLPAQVSFPWQGVSLKLSPYMLCSQLRNDVDDNASAHAYDCKNGSLELEVAKQRPETATADLSVALKTIPGSQLAV